MLESIDTNGWKVKAVDKHIAEVRRRFDEVLRVGPVKACATSVSEDLETQIDHGDIGIQITYL
ncbi:hypothetical protein [Rhodococcus sp. AG1013]|uniref:hypothetical protein n=1 Tax=Rhodococcus sp. AG1013 TaxID=2183996 RepID=UPI0015F07A27|nr:hypothetical protein [Rhodococcus sp. AG1013]